jgi:dienelactone hydrolase
VFIPDLFEGSPAEISWYPPNTDEKLEKLAEFFKTKADKATTLARIPGIVANADTLAPGGGGFNKRAIIGFCWGGKVANLAVGQDNVAFKVAVQCHPALLDPDDAKQVTVPMAMLPSKDEDVDAVKAYKENLKVPNYVETFSTQIHGWMAARSNLEDPEVRKEYERGYRTVLGFLHEHL